MPRAGDLLANVRTAGSRDWLSFLRERTQCAHTKVALTDFMAAVLGDDAEATFVVMSARSLEDWD